MNTKPVLRLIVILLAALAITTLAAAQDVAPGDQSDPLTAQPAFLPADGIWRPLPGGIYLSTAAAGKIGGLAFAPADIIYFDPAAGWSMVFDASDTGITNNVVAFEILDDGSIWLVFAANQPIPGVGTFAPQDIARFVPTSTGQDTAGTFEWVFDGSAHALTTAGEKIDGLARWWDGSIVISTTGAADVIRPNGAHLRAQDEDVIGYDLNGDWWTVLDGTAVKGLAVEDVNGLWVDPDTDQVYLSTIDAFNLSGVRGNGKDIVRLRPQDGAARPSLLFDGSVFGLPARIDAIDLAAGVPEGLAWPVGCVPRETCAGGLGYPDIDNDGKAFNCGQPGYTGHQGTDIGISWGQMDAGMPVYAAADGRVQWVFDGKYDRCPADNPDCQGDGTVVCTDVGPYCWGGGCCCLWCFAGGNVVIIRHTDTNRVFATRYDHLKNGSILVKPGQYVSWGQKIAEAASAGNSTGPHLHFEVWGTDYYKLADPWAGACGPNFGPSLWSFNPPWTANTLTSAASTPASDVPFYGPEDVIQRYEPPQPRSLGALCPAAVVPAVP